MAKLPWTIDPADFQDDTPAPFTGLPDLPAIVELRSHRQWVAWTYEDRGGPKPTKVPINPRTGAKASTKVAATWGTCEEAERRVLRSDGALSGVGFVLTAGDEFVGIDLDDVVDERGTLAPWAAEVVGYGETYAELSPSRRGIRMIARGTLAKAVKQGDAGVELYCDGRYVTMTGDHLTGSPEEIRPAPRTIAALIGRAEAAKRAAGERKEITEKALDPAENRRPVATMGITSDPRLVAYVEQAFRDELLGLATAGKGSRNNQLNQAAFSLFQMVAAGWLSAAEVNAALVDAATQCGLVADDGMPQVLRTISSGRAAGMRQPREVPRDIMEAHEDAEAGARIVAGLKRGERVDPETGEITDIGIPITEQDQGVARKPDLVPALEWHGESDEAPISWTVKHLVPSVGCGLISGQWSAGKTFVALNLSASVMTGAPFVRHRVKRRGGVLYVLAEGQAGFSLRMKALGRRTVMQAIEDGYGDDIDPNRMPFARLRKLSPIIEMRGKVPSRGRGYAELLEAAKKADAEMRRRFDLPLAMIVLDTVMALGGIADKNSAVETAAFMQALAAIGSETGTFVFAVDHMGKDREKGTSGSHQMEANADVVLGIVSEMDEGAREMIRSLEVRKNREGASGAEVPFSLAIEEFGEDEDGDPVTSAVVEWAPPSEEIKEVPKARSRRVPKAQSALMKAFDMAAGDHGRWIYPHGGDGPRVFAVLREDIREAFYKVYVVDTDDVDGAVRKGFVRGIDYATEAGAIEVQNVHGEVFAWKLT